MNLEVAKFSQRVMTDEVQKVEVDDMNRPILQNRCHVVRIDRAILLITGVTESRQTIVTDVARTTIVATEIAVDLGTIDANDQDEDTIRRLMQMAMAITSPVMIALQTKIN